jgi:DNA-binding NtrC family response regulator
MQVKLLRVLQEGTFEPLGSEVTKKVDVRIICATNRNLKQMVEQGSFREDLYYRLAVVPIQIPPLRERRSDIVLLASSFLREFGATLGRKGLSFADETIDVMIAAQWPGNVRQLQNAIQYSLIKCRGNTVLPHHLPPDVLHSAPIPLATALPQSRARAGRKPVLTVAMVQQALAATDGNKAKAARTLGVGRATLYNFIASQTP